jgi:hypothetical protein
MPYPDARYLTEFAPYPVQRGTRNPQIHMAFIPVFQIRRRQPRQQTFQITFQKSK